MRKLKRNITPETILTVLFVAFLLSGCGGAPGSGNTGFTSSGSSSSKNPGAASFSSTDREGSRIQYLYLKGTYTLDNGEQINFEITPQSISFTQSPSKRSFLSTIQQARAPGGAWRVAYDNTYIGLRVSGRNLLFRSRLSSNCLDMGEEENLGIPFSNIHPGLG